MTSQAKYNFKIDGFAPESMPFGRLVEYYQELKKMLGSEDGIHLIDIVAGSHESAFCIDRSFETTFRKRLYDIKEGTAGKVALRAQSVINAMLAEDGTSGSLYDSGGAKIIIFPGRKAEESAGFRIRDTATFTGELYHISGNAGDAKARIATDTYGVVFCTTTRDIARSLRDFLFEDVRVSGRGVWTKLDDGSWGIEDFVITDFSPVKAESLRSAIDRIRALDVHWPKDPLAEIRDLEERVFGVK
uniref:hypothetical protein n=1 Tax=Brucella pseudintermedia TaxID=370111 RepID=UPI00158B4F83|nr:hypothetical protein [Brucella pseudintermedia]